MRNSLKIIKSFLSPALARRRISFKTDFFEILHGVYPETLHFVQSDNRRVQDDIGMYLVIRRNK